MHEERAWQDYIDQFKVTCKCCDGKGEICYMTSPDDFDCEMCDECDGKGYIFEEDKSEE